MSQTSQKQNKKDLPPGKKTNHKATAIKTSSKTQVKAGAKAKPITAKSTVSKSALTPSPSDSNLSTFFGSFCSISPACDDSTPSEPASEGSPTVVLGDNLVKINIYGLTKVNNFLKYSGLGIYHSGVQVFGVEWAYGGFPKPVPSIYRMKKPRDLASLSDIEGKFHYKETIEFKRTQFSYEEVKAILINMGQKGGWIGTNYHLLNRNCNHFSAELVKLLCNCTIPPWINRVATIFSKLPWFTNMLPEEYFTPRALQNQMRSDEQLKGGKVAQKGSNPKRQASKSAVSVASRRSTSSIKVTLSQSSVTSMRSRISDLEEKPEPASTVQTEKSGLIVKSDDECALVASNDKSTVSVTSLESSSTASNHISDEVGHQEKSTISKKDSEYEHEDDDDEDVD